MKRLIVSLVTGVLFGAGLALSGMTHPQKILGFLDITGDWDPTLLFVLGGAVGVTIITFRFILKRRTPFLDDRFYLTSKSKIDAPLLIGSTIFGIGWGIGGLCPGPAIAMAASPNREFWIFFPALVAGSLIHSLLWKPKAQPAMVDDPTTCG
jgi:uncharacterized membrane protein YedE/YeeE